MYITNRATSRTGIPLSSFLRCALSTTPDSISDTSGSPLSMSTKKKRSKKATTKLTVGDNTINNLPEIPSVIQSSSLSADFGSSASAKSSDTQSERQKPMNRDKKMAYLEEAIKSKEVALVSLSNEINALADERRAMVKLPEPSRDHLRLTSIGEDLAHMRKDSYRLAADIKELKKELSALNSPKEPAEASVPAQVISSFEQLLGSNFDANAQRNDYVLRPIFMPQLSRQGLDDIIKGSWDTLQSKIQYNHKKPILFVHSAPGCGKTYFLRELSRKLERDCSNIEISDKIGFVGISFNSKTSIDADRTYLNGLDSTLLESLPVLARIYFCLFTKATTNWFAFTKFLQQYFKLCPTNVGKFEDELSALIYRRFYKQGKKLVLLFDEITKIDFSSSYKVEADEKNISSRVMSYIGNEADRNNYFSLCLMSELNMNVIDSANLMFTPSGRGCLSVGKLVQLTESQVTSLFMSVVSKLVLSRVPGGKLRSKAEIDVPLSDLYFLTCGHPRTVDYLIEEVSNLKTEATLQHCVTQLLNRNDVTRLKSPAWDVMQAIFLAKPVKPGDVMPDSQRSYNVAIARGEIIASLIDSNKMFIPQIPEIMLHKWVHDNKGGINNESVAPATVQNQIANELKEILNVRFNVTDVSLETVLAGREYILSRIYGSPSLRSSYCNIRLNDLYPLSRSGGSDTSSKEFKVDASKPLIYSSENNVPTLLNNIIYKPTDPTNAGYDFRIRFSLAESTGKFVDVYYQVKFSEADSSTSLTSGKLQSSYETCASYKAHPDSAGFIVVFITWRKGGQYLDLPPGCLLWNRESMEATIGPNFSNFIKTLTKYPLLMVNDKE